MRSLCATCFTAMFGLALATPSTAQQSNGDNGAARKSMQAHRLTAGEFVDLDGDLVEDAWKRAVPATGFLQRDPDEGAQPTELTEVFVTFDENYLFIGAVLYDSDPAGIRAYQKQRDAGLGTDDRFMWILDTFGDGRTGYFFEINPAGLMGDGIIGGGGGGGRGGGGFGINKAWDGIWEARTARRPDGWSAEIRIPFRTLNFDPNGDTWGINFQRTVRRKNEESLWTGYRRNQQLTRPVHAGTLEGLQGMSQGVGLETTPYVVGGWTTVPGTADPTDFPTDAGFDISYNVTPSLRAAATINTDFAEVEVDQRRVNLTRFPLFFPERRDFFLEGSGVFGFAPRNGVTPYFSRNIGLSGGEQVPIRYGARLGGQAGRYELGFVHVHTGSDPRVDGDGLEFTVPSEDFTVARVKRTVSQQSSIGAIYTRRSTATAPGIGAAPDRHTAGFDLDLYTSRFLGDKNFQVEAFGVWNSRDDFEDVSSFSERTAWGLRVNYPNDIWRIHTSFRTLGDAHDPALGFTRRNGFRRVQPTVTFAPRPAPTSPIRQFEFQVQFEYLTDIDWRLETRKTDFKLLGLRFQSGDRFDFTATQLFERLDESFELNDVGIPAGSYDTWRWRASFNTSQRRQVSARVSFERGGFWSGTRNEYSLSLAVRPVPGVSVESSFERNDVDLAQGAFSTNLTRFEGEWHVSPWASLTSQLQYDDLSEIVGLFARFRWILTPGSDLFLVYTQNWQNSLGVSPLDFRYATLSRGGSTKLNYTYRF